MTPDDRARHRPEPQAQGNRFADAIRTLADVSAVHSLAYRERVAHDWSRCEPDLERLGRAVLAEAYRRGLPLIVSESYRSPARQAALHKQGKSLARAGQSPHQYGMAFDLIHWRRGWNLTDAEWQVIQAVVLECARKLNLQVRCGRDWDGDGDIHDQKLYDPAHFELADWRERTERPA